MIALAGTTGAVLFAILGLILGSFVTAASHRLPRGEPLGMDRSRCPSCGHPLGAVDLVPVISWLALRGRCRHCGAAVSWRYPAIEAATALLFVAAWAAGGGDSLTALLLALTATGLMIVTVADLEAGIIPDAVLVGMLPLGVAWRWHLGGAWIDAALGAALGFLGLLAVRAGFRAARGYHALGLGDVKFMGVCGFFVGIAGVAAVLLVGGIIGIVFGIAWRTTGRSAAFPFGPSLCAAMLLVLAVPDLPQRLGMAASG